VYPKKIKKLSINSNFYLWENFGLVVIKLFIQKLQLYNLKKNKRKDNLIFNNGYKDLQKEKVESMVT